MTLPYALLRESPPGEQDFHRNLAAGVPSLCIYAALDIEPEWEFKWQEATFLHGNTTLQRLSLVELQIESDVMLEQETTEACLCSTLKLQDTKFLQQVPFSALFPRVKHLSLSQRLSYMDTSLLDLQETSDTLRSVDIENHWYSNGRGVYMPGSILFSPNIISVSFAISPHWTLYNPIHPPALSYLQFLGYEQPNIQYISLDIRENRTTLEHMVHCCNSFQSPSYFPGLRQLPHFVFHNHEGANVSRKSVQDISVGLQGLRARGISISDSQIANTIWKYASK